MFIDSLIFSNFGCIFKPNNRKNIYVSPFTSHRLLVWRHTVHFLSVTTDHFSLGNTASDELGHVHWSGVMSDMSMSYPADFCKQGSVPCWIDLLNFITDHVCLHVCCSKKSKCPLSFWVSSSLESWNRISVVLQGWSALTAVPSEGGAISSSCTSLALLSASHVKEVEIKFTLLSSALQFSNCLENSPCRICNMEASLYCSWSRAVHQNSRFSQFY